MTKEQEEMDRGPKSICCNAPMQEENNQCLCCGADGSRFENPFMSGKEKQELVDEKINFNTKYYDQN